MAWLDGLVEILVSVEFTTLDDEVPGGPQSFGAYIISQATGFLDTLQSFGAYLRFQATGFFRFAAKL